VPDRRGEPAPRPPAGPAADPAVGRQVGCLFAGWREELSTCRKFAPAARSYTACRLMADAGLRVNEACELDLADVKWDLGLFGKLHVRHGKGARGSGPRERMVPLINNAGATLRWFVEDVWGQFGGDYARPGVPLLPSERKNADGSAARSGTRPCGGPEGGRPAHLTDWPDIVTPHVLRHFCASELYLPAWTDRGPGHIGARLDRHHDELRPRPRHPRRGRVDGRPAARRRAAEGTEEMKWNLRLAAANRGIWKASELQRMLADRDLVISAGRCPGCGPATRPASSCPTST